MKSLTVTIILLCFTIPAFAQDHPKAEFYAGYSYLRTNEETLDLNQFGLPGSVTQKNGNLNGWNVAMSYNPTSWLGFTGDFSGAYGTIDYVLRLPPDSITIGLRTNYHTLLAGPQFSVRGGRATAFGRAMIGAVIADQSVNIGGDQIESDATTFAFAAGGGVDVKINDNISWRVLQADAIFTRFETRIDGQKITGGNQPNLRLSSGFVFRNKD